MTEQKLEPTFWEKLLMNRELGGWSRKLVNGRSKLSDRPLAIPLHAKRPPTLAEQVARLVRDYDYQRVQAGEDVPDDEENWEEDDDQPFSPYEFVFDPVLGKEVTPKEFLKNQEKYKAAYAKKALDAVQDDPSPPPTKTKTSAKGTPTTPQKAPTPDVRPDEDE